MKNFFTKVHLLIISVFFITGCADWVHQRTYLKEMDEMKDGFFVPDRDFAVLPGDTGKRYRSKAEIAERTPAFGKRRKRWERKKFLRKERSRKEELLGEEEYKRYQRHREHFDNDSEKIYYMNLPIEERLNYLSRKRGQYRAVRRIREGSSSIEKRAIRRKQLYVGMGKEAVIQSWGRPEKIEFAGNPRMENEKWTFYHGKSRKNVFFESGLVQGWDIY